MSEQIKDSGRFKAVMRYTGSGGYDCWVIEVTDTLTGAIDSSTIWEARQKEETAKAVAKRMLRQQELALDGVTSGSTFSFDIEGAEETSEPGVSDVEYGD